MTAVLKKKDREIAFKGSQKNVYLIGRCQILGGLEILILRTDLGILGVKTGLFMKTLRQP